MSEEGEQTVSEEQKKLQELVTTVGLAVGKHRKDFLKLYRAYRVSEMATGPHALEHLEDMYGGFYAHYLKALPQFEDD